MLFEWCVLSRDRFAESWSRGIVWQSFTSLKALATRMNSLWAYPYKHTDIFRSSTGPGISAIVPGDDACSGLGLQIILPPAILHTIGNDTADIKLS